MVVVSFERYGYEGEPTLKATLKAGQRGISISSPAGISISYYRRSSNICQQRPCIAFEAAGRITSNEDFHSKRHPAFPGLILIPVSKFSLTTEN
jgi:hypothetical protein